MCISAPKVKKVAPPKVVEPLEPAKPVDAALLKREENEDESLKRRQRQAGILFANQSGPFQASNGGSAPTLKAGL